MPVRPEPPSAGSSSPTSDEDARRVRPRQHSPPDEEESTNGYQLSPGDTSSPSHDQQQRGGPAPAMKDQHDSYGGQYQEYLPIPILQPSFFGVEPYDEFTRCVGDWIYETTKNIAHKEHIEIEAKIGTIKDRNSGRRIKLPVRTETAIWPSNPPFLYVFDSDMSQGTHRHFNHQILNPAFTASQQSPHPIAYTHLHESDTFVALPGAGNRKVRIRRNKKTGQIVDIVEKRRLADLNVYCPMRRFDYRLSISEEVPMAMPDGKEEGLRRKDRMSYKHQEVQVDLTQVALENGTMSHELEVEVLNVPLYLDEAAAFATDQDNTYDKLLAVLLNTVRMLVKNAE